MVKLTSQFLFWVSIFFFLSAFSSSRGPAGRLRTAIDKYASRMFLLGFAYYVLTAITGWLEYSTAYITWGPYAYLAGVAINNFRGNNYQYFWNYFAGFYFIACFVLLPPYLYYGDYREPVEKDKYSSFMKSIFSLTNVLQGKKPVWNYTSRLGLLTVCVKLFYIPLLVSWVINNTFHQINISRTFYWDIATVNAYLVALFIYLDTLIFCSGYLLEFDILHNGIKSVEPTVLGWVVCLWCYPPFNSFSFRMFDHQIINIVRPYPAWVTIAMTCLITLLWGIFVWASLALGWKASNLTNRGIVKRGPYRFVRHPAYTVKLILWYIQGIFFGQYYVGLLAGFTVIYMLRAWTEERHLSNDPAYGEYKRLVRWKLIPGVL
jgi:protein-S-isoprenylcysteine O-methyltransferase Ste14